MVASARTGAAFAPLRCLGPVTPLDWIIVGFTVLMALWGYGQGLIVGALSLVGFAAGAVLGSRLGPELLEEGSRSPYAPLTALVGALLVGGVLASGLELLGFHLRRRMGDRLGVLDGIGGAALLACLGLGLAWIGGAVALQTPGASELREPIQRSAILQELNDRLPPSGPVLQALARFDPFPRIAGPDANVGPPDSAIARDPEVAPGGPQRGQGAGHGLRAGGPGKRLGGRRRAGGHQRACGGRPGRHQRAAARRGTAAGRRGGLVRSPQRPGAAARSRAVGHARAAAAHAGASRAPRPRSSGSPRTGRTTCARAAWAAPRPS